MSKNKLPGSPAVPLEGQRASETSWILGQPCGQARARIKNALVCVTAKQRNKRVHKEAGAEQGAMKNTQGVGAEAYGDAVVKDSVWETGAGVEEKE